MTDEDRGQTVLTHVGECRCPGTPHASGETVTFISEIPMEMGSAGMAALNSADTSAEYVGLLAPIYLRFGIESWTCLGPDERGQIVPLPVTLENARKRFPWAAGGMELIERADDLFGRDLVAPLAKRRATSYENGQTEPPTSPQPPTGSTPPKPSKPSSPKGSGAGKPFEVPAP